ncbi:MAG: cadherin-like domain-containing protein [Roseibium sp.]|uniref:Ig-like domain-containing protein n=1 Tax=Roseibium sp. TaxID=1936156 RepID=UPI00260AC0CD|nr:Ig-like domain-containing protein [Roseibium sp.]MCV0427154.1 cadherin-like domain-containing protein [Roseibium sp.]
MRPTDFVSTVSGRALLRSSEGFPLGEGNPDSRFAEILSDIQTRMAEVARGWLNERVISAQWLDRLGDDPWWNPLFPTDDGEVEPEGDREAPVTVSREESETAAATVEEDGSPMDAGAQSVIDMLFEAASEIDAMFEEAMERVTASWDKPETGTIGSLFDDLFINRPDGENDIPGRFVADDGEGWAPGGFDWPDVTGDSDEILHHYTCSCFGCSGQEDGIAQNEVGGVPAGSVTVSAPSPLGDLADYLTSGYWGDRNINTSDGTLSHNLGSSGTRANNGVLYFNVSGYSSDGNGLSAARAELVREAFKLFEATLGIQFIETTSTNDNVVDFFFSDNSSGAYANFNYYTNGTLGATYINVASNWSGGTSTFDDYTLQTILHEIGHALGLGHQGNYNGSASYPGSATFENDSWQASMMSYFSQSENSSINADYEFLQTPMSVDWMALDDLYGSQGYGVSNAFAGDTVYGFNTNVSGSVSQIWAQFATYGDQTAYTIVDGSGNDTLDLSGYGNNSVINLAPSDRSDTAPSTSSIGGRVGNLTIAEGTIIENAIGGSGSETFYGNSANNVLTGNGGNDTFHDSDGADTYYGNSGTDTVMFNGDYSDYTFSVSGSFLQVINAAVDLVSSTVEWIGFDDQTLSYQDVVDGLSGNAAPVAVNDSYSVSEDGTVSGNLLNNDSDANGDPLTVVQVNGVTASVGQQIRLSSGALLTVNANGTFDYDPNGAFDGLDDGQSDEDSFTYRISDGEGGVDDATVTIDISGATDNVAPVAVNDSYNVAEDGTVAGNLLNNDSDGNNDPLTVVQVNGVAASVGQQITLSSGALLTVNANGTFDYDPNGAFNGLNDGQGDEDSFTYRISDGEGGFDDATVTIDINGVSGNAAPVAVGDNYNVDEDGTVSGNLLNNDSDADNDPLTIVQVNGVATSVGQQITLSSGALLTVNANGTFDYDPNGAFDGLNDEQSDQDSFTYRISDGEGGFDDATVTIDIDGISPPAPDPDPQPDTNVVIDFEGSPNGAYTGEAGLAIDGIEVISSNLVEGGKVGLSDGFSITATDGDFSLDSLLLRSPRGRVQIEIAAYDDGELDDTVNATIRRRNGVYEIELGSEFDSIDEIVVTANRDFYIDNIQLVTSAEDQPDTNTSPTAVDDEFEVGESDQIAGDLLQNDSDPDGDNLTLLSVEGDEGADVELASGAIVSFNENGNFNYDPNGAFDHLLDGETAFDSFEYLVSDGNGGTDTATATITINGEGVVPTGPELHVIGFEGGSNGQPFLSENGVVFEGAVATNASTGVSAGNLAVRSAGQSVSFSLENGGDFDFEGAVLTPASGWWSTITVQGYDDGVLVGTERVTSWGRRETDYDTNDNIFDQVDEVVITSSNGIIIDEAQLIF